MDGNETEVAAAGCWRPTRRSPTKTVNPPAKGGGGGPPPAQAKPKKPIIKGPIVPPHAEWEGGSLAQVNILSYRIYLSYLSLFLAL